MQRALVLSSIFTLTLIGPLSGRPSKFGGGLQHTLIGGLPDGKPVCCEHEWNLRFLHYHPASVVPRRMYFAGCDKKSDNPKMLVSFSLGRNAKHPKPDPSSGAILQARFDPATGKFSQEGRIRHFPECVWMEGIAASSDCGTVAALCRRRYNDRDYDFDALATHEAKGWMTQPKCAKLAMWLYEWKNGDIHSKPTKTLLHKAVDFDWEVGNWYLRLGENDKTYGIGLKSRVVDPKGQCHEADAFLVLNQDTHRFTKRGYSWACGTGHTTFNRHAYNPRTKKYASFCTTDGSPARKTDKLGGLWFRPENRAAKEFGQINNIAIHNKGGNGTILPLRDGGFLGVIVGVPGKVPITRKMPVRPPTQVGLVRFNKRGKLKMRRWIVSKPGVYISHPQIARLGPDRYLLGYGEMKRLNDPNDKNDESYRAPWRHFLVEIDGKGNFLTPVQETPGAGWGEQDEMVSLGNGRVGWAYVPNPELRPGGVIPNCNSPVLQLSAYVSKSPGVNENEAEAETAGENEAIVFSEHAGDNDMSKEEALCKNSELVGLKYHFGTIVDRVRGICAGGRETEDLGTKSGNGPKSFVCPGTGNRVTKLEVWAFGWSGAIDRIRVTCKNGESSGEIGGWGKDGKLQKAVSCPAGRRAVGLSGNLGNFLGVLGLACGK